MPRDTGNHMFWAHYAASVIKPQLALVVEVACNRILPTFDDIAAEADDHAEEHWNEVMQSAGSPDIDPGDIAESARDAGIDRYGALASMRQASLNIYAVLLHHLFEQHALTYHRREVLHRHEENVVSLLKISVFEKRVQERFGISIRDLPSWPTLFELRQVANVVKHAEGSSATELRGLHPEIFVNPLFRADPLLSRHTGSHVFMTAGGDDLFVTEDDLRRYGDATVSFWDDYFDAFGAAA